MKTLTQKNEIFLEFQRVVDSRRWQTRSERDEFKNEGWLIFTTAKTQIESVGYLVKAAFKSLKRNEKDRFSTVGGAISLNETDEDGRPFFDPAAVEIEFSKLDDLRAQLTDYERDFLDFVNENGTAKIAKIWGCSQRTVQNRCQDFVEQVRARLGGRGQGDLFASVQGV